MRINIKGRLYLVPAQVFGCLNYDPFALIQPNHSPVPVATPPQWSWITICK